MANAIHFLKSNNIPIIISSNPTVFKTVFLDIGLANHLSKIKLIELDLLPLAELQILEHKLFSII